MSQISESAAKVAKALDDERASGTVRSPLHGIPFLLKETISTTDDLETTCGSTALVGAKPRSEATVVQKLRESGTIILGKSAVSEWASYRSPLHAPGGWSATAGHCFGAFHDKQTPSGSSCGSAVAISLGLAAASIATETHGSIMDPASRAGVVGFKPTVGLVSRHGVYPASKSQDSVGVIASSVLDAAIVMDVISDRDEKDEHTIRDFRDNKDMDHPNYFASACRSSRLDGLRIGVPRHVLTHDSIKDKHLGEALGVLSKLGATVVEDVRFSEFREGYYNDNRDEWDLAMLLDLRDNTKEYLDSFEVNPHEVHTLKDLIQYTKDHPDEMASEYGMMEWEKAEKFAEKYAPDSPEVAASMERRHRMGRQIPQLMDRYNCDLLVLTGSVDTTAEVGGCPCLSVPLGRYPDDQETQKTEAGHVDVGPNIPFGIQFVGPRHSDLTLLKVGHAFETATTVAKTLKPIVEPTTEL